MLIITLLLLISHQIQHFSCIGAIEHYSNLTNLIRSLISVMVYLLIQFLEKLTMPSVSSGIVWQISYSSLFCLQVYFLIVLHIAFSLSSVNMISKFVNFNMSVLLQLVTRVEYFPGFSFSKGSFRCPLAKNFLTRKALQ